MKKILFALLCVLSFGCAGEFDDGVEGEEFGTLEQSIFVPSEYGIEASGVRCIPPWDGLTCTMPDQKTLKWRFPSGHGCSPWTVTYVRQAMTQLAAFWGADFAIAETPAPNNNATIACNTTETAAQNPRLGRTQFFGGEGHSTPNGTLQQYGTAQITIYEGKIFAAPTFNCIGQPCELRRQSFMMNVARHEAGGHALGLGHDATDNQGAHLMDASFSTTDNTKAAYQGSLSYSTAEFNGIDCYNQNSGSGDDCAD